MKPFAKFASFLVAAAIAIVALAAEPAEAQSANTDGQHVFASAVVSDATGVVTTVATAGTYVTVGTAAPLAAGLADTSGAITYTLATNRFTVATRQGVGILKLTACLDDTIGILSKTWTGAWHRVRSGSTTLVGPIIRSTEPATADRNSEGCVVFFVDALQGDTYDYRYDQQTSADTVTTRAATFVVEKYFSK